MADPIADLYTAIAMVNDIERAYLELLARLNADGATDERIAAVAIDDRVRRYATVAGRGHGQLGWGATSYDLGKAAVEALRHCGRLRPAERCGHILSKLHSSRALVCVEDVDHDGDHGDGTGCRWSERASALQESAERRSR